MGVAIWFWECVASLDAERCARLLAFATGSARVPPGGFASMGFEINFDRCPTHLPTAHTCAHQLTLPMVENKHDLEKKLSRHTMERRQFPAISIVTTSDGPISGAFLDGPMDGFKLHSQAGAEGVAYRLMPMCILVRCSLTRKGGTKDRCAY